MIRKHSKLLGVIVFWGDICCLNLSIVATAYFIDGVKDPFNIEKTAMAKVLMLNLLWATVISTLRSHYMERIILLERAINQLLKVIIIYSFTVVVFVYMLKQSDHITRKFLIFQTSFLILFIVSWRLFMVKALKLYRRKGYNYKRVIILGAGPVGNELYDFFRSDVSYGFRCMGFFDDNPEKCLHSNKVIGPLSEVKEFALTHKVDEIYSALPASADDIAGEIMLFAEKNLIRFKIIPDFKRFIWKKVKIDFYNKIPIVFLRDEPLEIFVNRLIKNAFDKIFCLVILVLVFSWLFPILAVIIKLTSRGPVFFKQKRSGKNNEEFWCYKFRSMRVNELSDTKQATKNDDRITPIGRILRKTNLDELPQLFNVLKGEMSIIGPRPHMLKHTLQYSKVIEKFMVRHYVKPGITGWAQVNGHRGETQTIREMEKRVQYDVWYIENWSILLDLKILYLTVFNMIRGDKKAY